METRCPHLATLGWLPGYAQAYIYKCMADGLLPGEVRTPRLHGVALGLLLKKQPPGWAAARIVLFYRSLANEDFGGFAALAADV